MMPNPARWTAAVIGAVLAASILILLRRDRMQVRYALWWFFVAAAALLFGVFPDLLDAVGNFLGIHYPPILLVVISLALLFVKSLTQDLDRCRREENIRRLAQRIAILEGSLYPDPLTEAHPESRDGPPSVADDAN